MSIPYHPRVKDGHPGVTATHTKLVGTHWIAMDAVQRLWANLCHRQPVRCNYKTQSITARRTMLESATEGNLHTMRHVTGLGARASYLKIAASSPQLRKHDGC